MSKRSLVAALAAVVLASSAHAQSLSLKVLGQPAGSGLIAQNKEKPFFEALAKNSGLDVSTQYLPVDVAGIPDSDGLRVLKSGLFDIVSIRGPQVMLGATQVVTQWVAGFELHQVSLLLVLIVFYIILGMFMDAMSMLVLTVPIAVPMVTAVGVDPTWFGIFIILMCEIALITPPVGMNLFVVQGLRRDGGSFNDVVLGAMPYVFIMIGFVILTMAFPQIVMWLPDTLAGR